MQQGDCLNWDFIKRGERLAPDRYQDFVSVRSLRAAFQDQDISRLERQRGYLRNNVGPGFKDDPDNTQRA